MAEKTEESGQADGIMTGVLVSPQERRQRGCPSRKYYEPGNLYREDHEPFMGGVEKSQQFE